MATDGGAVLDITMPASEDMSGDQFRPVVVQDDGQVLPGAGGGSAFLGILQNKPAAENRAAVVRIAGISKVVASDALNERDLIATDASGFANATTTDTQFYVGQMITAAAASAVIAECVVAPGMIAG